MIKCPKCGFEQPKDVFCAHCGVNIEKYAPPIQSFVEDIKRSMKSISIVIIILFACYFFLKAMGRVLQTKNRMNVAELNENTQLGVGATSLVGEKNANPEPTNKGMVISQQKTPIKATSIRTAIEKKEKNFRELTATFEVSEMANSDFNSDAQESTKKWHVMSQASTLTNFLTQEMTLHKGNNNFVYEDGVIRIDESLIIEKISEDEVLLKVNYHRSLKIQSANERNNNIELNQKIPIGSELVIIDSLPRRVRANRADSILSTLFRSETFLSHASEMVQIIKFENPRTILQE